MRNSAKPTWFQGTCKLLFLFSLISVLTFCNKKEKTEETKKTEQPKEQLTSLSTQLKIEQRENADTLIKAHDLELFDLTLYEKKAKEGVGFISLSDILGPSNPIAFPNISDKKIKEAEYFTLESKYRSDFLTAIKISENSKVFIYDYGTNVLVTFPVKNLSLVAHISPYVSEEDWPYSFEDYMIGFEINPKSLIGIGQQYHNTLVYIGEESPFIQGQIKPIKWKEIQINELPTTETPKLGYSKITAVLLDYGYSKNDLINFKDVLTKAYKYELMGFQYFVIDFLQKRDDYTELIGRRLFVIKSETQEQVCEKNYVESDRSSPTPLNYTDKNHSNSVSQWTGNLFKNRPSVLFGFEYLSFGCPEITFLTKSVKSIYINCDNRH